MFPKTLTIIIAIMLIITCFFIIPTGSGSTSTNSFGSWEFKLIGTTVDGEVVEFEPINNMAGQLLSWSYNGEELQTVTCEVYAKATGEGYDYCDLDISDCQLYPFLYQSETQQAGGSGTFGTDDIISIPVNSESGTKIIETICNFDEMENKNVFTDGTMTLQFVFAQRPLRFRGRSGSNTDPWSEQTETFQIETQMTITYEEKTCGDGNCENEPYPGENCYTCPGDCGGCNSKIESWSSVHGEGVEPNCNSGEKIRYKYHTDNGWSSWMDVNYNSHLEVFYHHNVFGLHGQATVNGVLHGRCRMYAPEGGVYDLNVYKPDSWNEQQNEYVHAGDYVHCYWSSGWSYNHLLTQNGEWYLDCRMWIEPDGTTDTKTLVVKTTPNNCMVDLLTHPIYGSPSLIGTKSSGTSGATFDFLEDDQYQIIVYKEGYENKEQSVTLTGDITTVDVSLTLVSVPTYQVTISCDMPGAIITCDGIQEQFNIDNPWQHNLPNGNYYAYAEFTTHNKGVGFTVNDAPVELFIWLIGTLQMVSKLTFTVNLQESSDFERYEYENRFLGV